ncbi:MAG: toxin HicA [Acidobacteria bacterium]|nr:MAG: toxin HicA [Acidobacteriota bacterium]
MANIDDLIKRMRKNPAGIRFSEVCRVCDHFFGTARQKGSSHRIYKTPWLGDPRVNIQNTGGQAKTYRVRQVLKAIERLEHAND